MGAENSIVFNTEQDSPTDGKKVVLTDPIPFEREAFIEETMQVCRYPVFPILEGVLRKCEVKDLTDFSDDPQQWEAKVVLNGKKVDAYSYLGFGRGDGTDLIAFWNRNGWNPETGCYRSHSIKAGFVGEVDVSPLVEVHTWLRFLKDPFRIEYYWEDYREGKSGERLANDEVVKILKLLLTIPMRSLSDRKAKLLLNESGTAAVSEPLDEFVGFESLMEGWFEFIKKYSQEKEKLEIKETMEGEQFFASSTIKGQDGKEARRTTKVDLIKDEGTLTLEHLANDEAIYTETIQITQDPLVVTCTRDDGGNTQINKAWLSSMQAQLDAVLQKETSGWFY